MLSTTGGCIMKINLGTWVNDLCTWNNISNINSVFSWNAILKKLLYFIYYIFHFTCKYWDVILIISLLILIIVILIKLLSFLKDFDKYKQDIENFEENINKIQGESEKLNKEIIQLQNEFLKIKKQLNNLEKLLHKLKSKLNIFVCLKLLLKIKWWLKLIKKN